MSAPLTPPQVEAHIRELTNRIARGIAVCNDTYVEFQAAERAFDRGYAAAYLEADGSIKDKEMQARIGTMPLREARDIAEAKYRHADRLAKSLDSELRAYQSIGASVRQAFAVAGVGER